MMLSELEVEALHLGPSLLSADTLGPLLDHCEDALFGLSSLEEAPTSGTLLPSSPVHSHQPSPSEAKGSDLMLPWFGASDLLDIQCPLEEDNALLAMEWVSEKLELTELDLDCLLDCPQSTEARLTLCPQLDLLSSATDLSMIAEEAEGGELPLISEEAVDAELPLMSEGSVDAELPLMSEGSVDAELPLMSEEAVDAELPLMSEEAVDAELPLMSEEAVDAELPLMSEEAVDAELPLMSEEAVDAELPLMSEEAVDAELPLMSEGAVDAELPLMSEGAVDAELPLMSEGAVDAELPLMSEEAVGAELPLMSEGAVDAGLPLMSDEEAVKSEPPSPPHSLALGSEVDLPDQTRRSQSDSDSDSGIESSPPHTPQSGRSKPYSRPQPDGKLPRTKAPKSVDKKLKKMEQNKTAATRYRQKKRVEQEELHDERLKLEQKNQELKERAQAISREIQYLQDLMEEVRRHHQNKRGTAA